MYGHRARVGYACPPRVAEVFVYEFYKIAPPGVTLAISTVGGGRASNAQLQDAFRVSMEAAEELAKTGVNAVVLGGEPLNASIGADELQKHLDSLSKKYSIPFTTSLTAQAEALRVLGAKKVAVVSYGSSYGEGDLVPDGIEIAVSKNGGISGTPLATISIDVPVRLAREAKKEHPEIDSIKIRTAHWNTLEAIDALEKELDVNVVSASQAITWHGLRTAGIKDSIQGCGRLLREH